MRRKNNKKKNAAITIAMLVLSVFKSLRGILRGLCLAASLRCPRTTVLQRFLCLSLCQVSFAVLSVLVCFHVMPIFLIVVGCVCQHNEDCLSARTNLLGFSSAEKGFSLKGFWQQSDINLCKSCETLRDKLCDNFATTL